MFLGSLHEVCTVSRKKYFLPRINPEALRGEERPQHLILIQRKDFGLTISTAHMQ